MRRLGLVAVLLLSAASLSAQSRWYDAADYANAALAPGAGVNYYIDGTNGLDTNDGLTVGTAFKTIRKATDKDLAPGTRVIIKAGVYHEKPNLGGEDSGTVGNPIMLGPYGDGPVIVDGGWNISTWTNYSGQIYYATVTSANGAVVDEQALFPITPVQTWGTTPCNPATLTEGTYCFVSSESRVYVWAPGGGTPAAPTHDTGILKVDAVNDGLFVNTAHDVVIYGLTVRFSANHGINILGNNVRVELSRAIFNTKAGINAYTYGTIFSTGFEAIKNELYYNCMNNWPRGRLKWSGWASGIALNAVTGGLFQGNVSHKNSGEGMGSYSGAGGLIARDNISYDNWSVQIYVGQGEPNTLIERNYAYATGFYPEEAVNNGWPSNDEVIIKKLRGVGILMADEGLPMNLSNMTVRNNLIVNCRRGIDTYFGDSIGAAKGLINMTIVNNTVIVPTTTAAEEVAGNVIAGIVMPHYGGGNTGTVFKNNVVYASDAYSFTLHRGDDPGDATRFSGLTIDHNALYHSGRLDHIHWGPSASATYDLEYSEWLALAGDSHGTGDITADPQLVNATNLVALDKTPAVGSPLINAGATVAVEDDWALFARATIDIGGLEYNGSGGGTTLSIVTTSPLPACTRDVECSSQLVATGGTTPYSWSDVSGTHCTGMSLTSGGLVTGTPTVAQTCTFTVRVTDSATPTPATADLQYSLTINAPTSLTASLTVIPGQTTQFILSVPSLPREAACQVAIAVDSVVVRTLTSQSGYASRTFTDTAVAAGTYTATGECPGVSTSSEKTYTVASYGAPATRSVTLDFTPIPLLSTAAQVFITYGLQPESQLADSNTDCATTCRITVSLDTGRWFVSHQWRNSGGTAITPWSLVRELIVD